MSVITSHPLKKKIIIESHLEASTGKVGSFSIPCWIMNVTWTRCKVPSKQNLQRNIAFIRMYECDWSGWSIFVYYHLPRDGRAVYSDFVYLQVYGVLVWNEMIDLWVDFSLVSFVISGFVLTKITDLLTCLLTKGFYQLPAAWLLSLLVWKHPLTDRRTERQTQYPHIHKHMHTQCKCSFIHEKALRDSHPPIYPHPTHTM